MISYRELIEFIAFVILPLICIFFSLQTIRKLLRLQDEIRKTQIKIEYDLKMIRYIKSQMNNNSEKDSKDE